MKFGELQLANKVREKNWTKIFPAEAVYCGRLFCFVE